MGEVMVRQVLLDLQVIQVLQEIMEIGVLVENQVNQVNQVILTSLCHQVSGVGIVISGNELLEAVLHNKL